jgi:hypothetical protein
LKFPFVLFIILVNLLPISNVAAQELFKGLGNLFTPPKSYTVFRTRDKISVDGNFTEPDWGKASWSAAFVDIEGDRKPLPTYNTRFKLLWDARHLYVAVEMEEPHTWATIRRRDAIIYHDNDIEIFIDPDGDTHNYFEIELNAFNTVFDLFMPKPYRNGGKAATSWNAEKLRSAIKVNGTLNDPSDKDKNWRMEMAIPFSSLKVNDTATYPTNGSTWRLNFSRVQWDVDVTAGGYVKRMDTLKKRPLPEHNWVWSPQGVINMHYPERWGYVQFSDHYPGTGFTAPSIPASEKMKDYLWLIYYRQQEYFRKNKGYATDLQELHIPSNVTFEQKTKTLHLEKIDTKYRAIIKGTSPGESWQINQEGRITRLDK